MGISALTIVRNRSAHLTQLVEGLRRSNQQPDELIANEGWLADFGRPGLVRWKENALDLIRLPTAQEIAGSRVEPVEWYSVEDNAAIKTAQAAADLKQGYTSNQSNSEDGGN